MDLHEPTGMEPEAAIVMLDGVGTSTSAEPACSTGRASRAGEHEGR